MTLSREPPPAPCLRSQPARRWAAGAPQSCAGGGAGGQGHLAGAGDVQDLEQLLGPCGGCWWGAGASLLFLRDCLQPGHGPGLHRVAGAEGSVGACTEWGEPPALFLWGAGLCVLLGGAVWLGRAGAGCSGRGWTALCHCPTAWPPATPKLLQTPVLGGGPGGTHVLAHAARHPSFAHPACMPSGCWHRAEVLPRVSCVWLLCPTLWLFLWVAGVQLASSLWSVAGSGCGRVPYLPSSRAGPRLRKAGRACD